MFQDQKKLAAARYESCRRCEIIQLSVGITIALLFGALIVFGVVEFEMHDAKQEKAKNSSRNPRAYVQDLYVPGLLAFRNKDTSTNSSVIIGLEFKRGAALKGDVAMYSDLNMNLFYGVAEDPSYAVGNHTVPPFRMGRSRSVQYEAVVEAPSLPWEDALDKISGGSPVLLRLVLIGKFKVRDSRKRDSYYNASFVWTEFQSEAEVWVNASAHMLSDTPVLFK